MAETKKTVKKTKTEKRDSLDKRKLTTQRYIDDSEGINVTKRPAALKKGK